MRQPHNLWREVWSVAEALPVHRQKKLFDDTREAEKVLHYLAGLKTAELGLLVLPVLVHSAIQALQDKHGLCMFACLYCLSCLCMLVLYVCWHCMHICTVCTAKQVTCTHSRCGVLEDTHHTH